MSTTPDFEDLFEDAPCGYLLLDERGRITKANRTLLSWLEMTEDDVSGKRLLDLMPVAGRMFFETHFAPLLRMQGHFHEVALDLVRKDGVRLPVLANANQKTGREGGVLETRIALFEATSRRKYERELFDANEAGKAARREVEALNSALTSAALLRDEFIAVLGHDLRNPLASVKAGVRFLSNEPISVKGSEVVRLVDGSVDRMTGLVNDVLDLASGRLGGGIAVARREELDLGPILRQVVSELESATGRKIGVEIDLPGAALVDRGRIGQLASNLLGNAFTHGDPARPVAIRAGVDDDILVIAVSNGGEPIPRETMERLFQPFFRGGDPNERQHGLGLGLHIASEIAKAHGGTLTVTSDHEATVFEFRMPGGPTTST
jgi:sigma-B regulation protein RsbU (phosphoserine phosphatase)